MFAHYAFLILGGSFAAFFIAMLAGGSLLGLARLVMQTVGEATRPQDATAEATLSQPVLRLAAPREAAQAETSSEPVPAYVLA